MIESRIHGRRGQGYVVTAYLLANAAFEDGSHDVFDYGYCKGCGLCAQECPSV